MKPWQRLARSDGRLIFEYAQEAVVLEGKAVGMLLPILLPLLDGTRTIEEINREMGADAAPATQNAIATLNDRGLLTEGPPLEPETPKPLSETAQFFSALSDDPVSASEEALGQASVSVLGTGPTAGEIARLIGGSGVGETRVLEWGQGGAGAQDLAIVAPEPQELGELEAWNGSAIESGAPWLQALPFDGLIAAVGPLYVPGETGCYECYRRRRAANVSYSPSDYWALEAAPAAYPSPPPLRSMVASLAAMFALQWLSDRASDRASSAAATMYALEWGASIELSNHRVYRVPRCPICFPDDLGVPALWHD